MTRQQFNDELARHYGRLEQSELDPVELLTAKINVRMALMELRDHK